MSNANLSRRDFFKLAGLAGISMPLVRVVGKVGGDDILYSPEQYGGFLIRKHSSDSPPYQVDESLYQRFDEKNTVFCRMLWDPIIQEAEAPFANVPKEHIQNNDPGFTRLDYAFYTASWAVTRGNGTTHSDDNTGLYSWQPLGGPTGMLYELPPWEPADYTPEEVSAIVKTAARFYGASMAGIAELDERWLYSNRYTRTGTAAKPAKTSGSLRYEDAEAPQELEDGTLIIPRSIKYVIALAFEMDQDGIDTYIGGPASAACGEGYSRMAYTSAILSEFIRGLGYKAIPAGNSTGQSIAFAIDAGLGELGRNGLLVTPKYGPRVRLAKVFTDMPLVPDKPITFGVEEFCNICGKCATNCPGSAIPTGEKTFTPTYDAVQISSNPGVKKWYVNTPACHQVWAEYGMDCGTCMRVCPFNKPEGWLHEATRVLIGAKSGSIDNLLVNLDDASGFGEQKDSKEFWEKKKVFIHTKEA